MLQMTTWDDAVRILCRFLKLDDHHIDHKHLLLPDKIADCATSAGYDVLFTPVADFEDKDDEEILDELVPLEWKDLSDVLVISDASFCYDGPFMTVGNALNPFVIAHREKYNWFVFNGDAILVFLKHSGICIIHHEGYKSVIKATS